MKIMFYRLVLLLLSVQTGFLVHAQETEQPDDTTTATANGTTKIDTLQVTPTGQPGKVEVKADERLKLATEFMGTPVNNEPIVKIKGYRVQVYFSNDKDLVNQQRADFMSQNPKIPVYVDYLAPNFRLRAGNFRTRLPAEKLQFEINTTFPDAIVIEDWIELPTLRIE
jgi:hypothetical protein